MSRIYGERKYGAGLLIACVLMHAACAKAPEQTTLMEERGATGMTADALRLRLHEFAIRFAGEMEQTALGIGAENEDPDIEASLIRWQLFGIPAYTKTLFQSDPYLGLWDSWVLTAQIIDYYQDGPGSSAFGEYQDRVIAVHRSFYDEFAHLERLAYPEGDQAQDHAVIEAWVDGHPIQTDLFTRQSVLMVDSIAEIVAGGGGGLGAALQSVEAGMADMNTRMTVYTDYIPRQVQWQIQLSAMEMLAGAETDLDLEELLGISGYLSQVDTMVANHMTLALASIERQRAAVFAGIAAERRAVLEGIATERAAVLAGIGSERSVAMREIEQLVQETLAEVNATSEWAFSELVRDALLIIVAGLIAAIIYRFVAVRVIGPRRV